MSTGVLTGQITMVFAIATLGVSIATQWTAAALGHQAHLGAPWFLLVSVGTLTERATAIVNIHLVCFHGWRYREYVADSPRARPTRGHSLSSTRLAARRKSWRSSLDCLSPLNTRCGALTGGRNMANHQTD